MHPRHEVEKEYHVRVRGKVAEQQLKRLAEGVELEEGKTAPAEVRMVKSGEQNDWISVTIHEGRNRQVRRMCEAVSLSVVRLRRVRYGSLVMGTLKPGQFRYLSEAEVNSLRNPSPSPVVTSKVSTENTRRDVHRARPEQIIRTEKKNYAPRTQSGSAATRPKSPRTLRKPGK
jgi:RNA pseudouridylate synthase